MYRLVMYIHIVICNRRTTEKREPVLSVEELMVKQISAVLDNGFEQSAF